VFLLDWVTQRLVDVRIKYVTRDQLPDEVRPKAVEQQSEEIQKVGEKRE
jgi:hypothetical protein